MKFRKFLGKKLRIGKPAGFADREIEMWKYLEPSPKPRTKKKLL